MRHLSKDKYFLFDELFDRYLKFDLQKDESLSFNNYDEFADAVKEYNNDEMEDLAAQLQLDEMRGK